MAQKPQHINPIDQNPDIAIGIKLPFSQKSGRLFEQSYTTEEQVDSNLRSLLLTAKGERIMQPTFGTDIYNTLFDQSTPDVVEKLKRSIAQDIAYWLPYIIIKSLTVQWQEDEIQTESNSIYISLIYLVDSGTESEKEIILFTNLDGVRIL